MWASFPDLCFAIFKIKSNDHSSSPLEESINRIRGLLYKLQSLDLVPQNLMEPKVYHHGAQGLPQSSFKSTAIKSTSQGSSLTDSANNNLLTYFFQSTLRVY